MKVNNVFLLAAFAAATSPALAQEKTIEERVSKVEGITSKLPTISGLVNTRFQYDAVENQDATNSFDVRRARLDIKGGISSKVDYRIQLELSGAPKILDAFVTWKPSSYINLRVGQFKYPFTLENPYSPTTLETIENSTVISKLSG
ncbi:MAG: OprO/OprP family phosphate-selective porin, partial [Tannerellaceae bacterium]|nr:OprO/OprP family phosphate-selective porin [Tannerellaceae bacterium]